MQEIQLLLVLGVWFESVVDCISTWLFEVLVFADDSFGISDVVNELSWSGKSAVEVAAWLPKMSGIAFLRPTRPVLKNSAPHSVVAFAFDVDALVPSAFSIAAANTFNTAKSNFFKRIITKMIEQKLYGMDIMCNMHNYAYHKYHSKIISI